MIVVLVLLIIGFLVSKKLFNSAINPLSMYSIVWAAMLILYNLGLIDYVSLSTEALIFIFLATFSLYCGAIVHFLNNRNKLEKKYLQQQIEIEIFKNEIRNLRVVVLGCSVIGILAAIQHWSVLISEFGSVPAVLLNLGKVYQMRVAGEIKGVVPYFKIFSFVGVYFSSIYFVKRNKVDIFTFLPLFGVILSEIANVGRAGILFALILFFSSIINQKYSYKIKLLNIKRLIGIIFILLILVLSAVSIKTLRGGEINHNATSLTLRNTQDNPFINPTIYTYLCGHIGAFSKYLETDYDNYYKFGHNSFQSIYNIFAKFEWVEKPDVYPDGYNIPVWINTGTYLMDLHQDFGNMGLLIVPFLIGYLALFLWNKYLENKNLVGLLFISYLEVYLVMTFLMSFSRNSVYFTSFVLTFVIVFLYEQKFSKF